MSSQQQVISDNKVSKNFSYSKGKVALNFILRIDVTNELKDFLELLKVATKEVENELK